MADAQLKLSRRALLGAACAIPALPVRTPSVRSEPSRGPAPSAAEAPSAHPEPVEGPPSAARSAWNRALSRFQEADAILTALEGHPDEDAFGRAHDRFNAALRRLLAHPAPDLAALAAKLEIADRAELADLTYAPPSLSALAQDARRLASRSS
jgi:hypothetical protein